MNNQQMLSELRKIGLPATMDENGKIAITVKATNVKNRVEINTNIKNDLINMYEKER